ncbi:MAG TPA: S53 family peptidase, partial [Ktedonobacteraceae bacterium]
MALLDRVCRSLTGRAIVLVFFLLLVPLASCGTPQPLQITNLNLGIPANALNSPVTGPLPDKTQLHVRFTFKLDPNLLKQADQQRGQPGQRSKLESFASKIGISDATYQKIKDFFSLQGISLKLSKLRTNLSVDAKASTFAKLLQTKFVLHTYNGRTFFAPSSAPKLPGFLASSIDAVTGLDNYSAGPTHDFAMQFNQPPTQARPGQDCSPLDQTLLPREVAGAYGYSQLWNRGLHGENMTVNLIEIDGAYQQDIQNYFDCIKFPSNHFSVTDVDGSPQQALDESTLDIEMVAGLARSTNIKVYQTDGSDNTIDVWGNVNDELQQLISDNVNNNSAGNVVSISLGAAEGDMTSQDMRALDSSFQQLTRILHMTVFVASGDCGAFTSQRYGDLSVSFPASDPWVTAVGGTILTPNGTQGRANESVWSDGSDQSSCKNAWGSGGGNSAVFQRPGWQNVAGVNNRYSHNDRQLPDVSAAAYALAVYFQGRWGAVGGTSAAAPIWAAGLVLVNQGMLQQIHKLANLPSTAQQFYSVADQ